MLAPTEGHKGTMKWSSPTIRIVIGCLLSLQVAALFIFLLGPSGPLGEVAGLTFVVATLGYLLMLPIILLVLVIEGLWMWIITRKTDTKCNDHHA